MELDCYRNYLAIVEAGSFSGAAEIVKMTQPALSKQLKTIETQYGTKLIVANRGNRKLSLTEAGKLFYQKAKQICLIEESIRHELQEISSGISGTLKISITNAKAKFFISNVLDDFSKLYPQVNFEIHEGSTVDQSQQILSGITELGVFGAPIDNKDCFEILFRHKVELSVVYHRDTNWFDNNMDITINSFEGIPLSISSGFYEIFKNCCTTNGFDPQILCISSTRFAALLWAQKKSAAAIVSVDSNESLSDEFIIKPIKNIDVNLFKTIVKAADKPLSPVAQKFVEFYAQKIDNE